MRVQKVSIFSRKAAWPVSGRQTIWEWGQGSAHLEHLGIGRDDVFPGGDQEGGVLYLGKLGSYVVGGIGRGQRMKPSNHSLVRASLKSFLRFSSQS